MAAALAVRIGTWLRDEKALGVGPGVASACCIAPVRCGVAAETVVAARSFAYDRTRRGDGPVRLALSGARYVPRPTRRAASYLLRAW